MNFPDNLRYTKDHEWIRVDGQNAFIGITEYAQGELGDIVFVQLPAVGATLKQGQTFGTVEAVKAVSDIYAPASGTIVELNKTLEGAPESINKDPYGAGWMVKISLANASELDTLMTADQYKVLTGK